jgi:hypothetical protein
MPGINEIYRLRDNNASLTIEVNIGYAAKAATIVKLDGKPQNGLFIDSFRYETGTEMDLNGKELDIISMVNKIISGNDNSSVTITLRGGYEDATFLIKDHSTLNPVDFRATITLIL